LKLRIILFMWDWYFILLYCFSC